MKSHYAIALAVSASLVASAALAHDDEGPIRADGHAPIGVMGDHTHKTGEVMFSYRFMRMEMDGNRIGTDSVSPETIVTTVANPNPGPATLRVVPTNMTMDMHMFGAMYAPTDWLTLMGMVQYIQKDMDHITFAGMAGTTRLGEFTTRSKGFGDSSVTALVRLYDDGDHRVHANFGLGLPTGSITEEDEVLTPMNTRPRLRLPYAMQLGTGTFDLLPGLTYAGRSGDFGWGAQATSALRLGRNSQGYSFGDEFRGTTWVSYSPQPWVSFSGRVAGKTVGKIDGGDDQIAAPVQTADPDNYGGETVDLSLGVNLVGQRGVLRGHRIAAEFGTPVYQDLNGPQMETDWTFTIGYQYAF
ncbi:MAG: transporter [Pseudomonadota bacterium]